MGRIIVISLALSLVAAYLTSIIEWENIEEPVVNTKEAVGNAILPEKNPYEAAGFEKSVNKIDTLEEVGQAAAGGAFSVMSLLFLQIFLLVVYAALGSWVIGIILQVMITLYGLSHGWESPFFWGMAFTTMLFIAWGFVKS